MTKVGSCFIINDQLLTKLALVMDDHSYQNREELWLSNEIKAEESLYKFNRKDLFHEQELRDGSLIYQFRYYTPEKNRISDGKH